MAIVFPMRASHIFIIVIHQVLTHFIHTFPYPITHLTTLSHALGDKDDSRSYLASTAKAENQHQTWGKVERTPLTSQVKPKLRKGP
jgi:hypothetical protein